MSPARILVTGADGFVGRHLLPQLVQAFPAARIVGTSFREADGYATLDITRFRDVADLVRETQPDACVHLAAIAAIGEAKKDPHQAMLVNYEATACLADALLSHAPDCRFLFVSSADVYGAAFAAGRAMTEDDAPRPMNAYGASKAAAEMLLSYLAHDRGLRCVIARPTNHTGPGQQRGFVVPDFCAEILRAKATGGPVRTGRLDPARDFLDVRDVCAAYVRMLTADLAPGTVLNVASGTPRIIGDVLAGLLSLAAFPDANLEPAADRLRRVDIPVARVNSTRLRALGWAPATPWDQTLADTFRATHPSFA